MKRYLVSHSRLIRYKLNRKVSKVAKSSEHPVFHIEYLLWSLTKDLKELTKYGEDFHYLDPEDEKIAKELVRKYKTLHKYKSTVWTRSTPHERNAN